MTDIGDTAPDFTLPQTDGTPVTLSALKGAPVVLYFYPRDSTPGCTTEALDFTALLPDFKAAGAHVFGISKDSLTKHQNFTTKQNLTVPLLSDAESDVCARYGVWVEKKMYGKTHLGIQRATFLIDATGAIAHVWPKVKVAGHADEVLETVRAL